jgi:pre-mRNA-processing factor 6
LVDGDLDGSAAQGPQRGPLKKRAGDPFVFCTVARHIWAERKIDMAHKWFDRAVAAGPGIVDAWARWIGTAPQAEDVASSVAAERHHGTAWQSIAKDDANRGKSTREPSRTRRDRVAMSVP